MLFMYIHTHPLEKCVADKPEESKRMWSQVREEAAKAGVKIHGAYAAGYEHTTYMILEADDYDAIRKVIQPYIPWGTARLFPVSSH